MCWQWWAWTTIKTVALTHTILTYSILPIALTAAYYYYCKDETCYTIHNYFLAQARNDYTGQDFT